MATTYTLDGLNLGEVSNETLTENAFLSAIPTPLGDSSETDVYDDGGATREWSISGVYNAASLADLRTFVTNLFAKNTGDQWDAVVFHSDLFNANFNVKINRINGSWVKGAPLKFAYNITLTRSR